MKPEIDLTHSAQGADEILSAINAGVIPDVYQRDGELFQVYTLENAITPGARDRLVTHDVLRGLLREHTDCIKWTKASQNKPAEKVPGYPSQDVCRDVLAVRNWVSVPELRGIVYTPVIRPDGSVITARGYDAATGIWCDPRGFSERHLRELSWDWAPDDSGVLSEDDYSESVFFEDQAKATINAVLGDFPWRTDADYANFLALLLTPLVRSYIPGALAPMGVISATAPASGKTLLTTILTKLYGGMTRNWVTDEDEQRKAITACFTSPSPIVTFDNVSERYALSSPVLAQLLTSQVWSDRMLNRSENMERINDKLWLATGNNVALGGDIASRAIMVELDPHMPKPEQRDTSKFAAGDLLIWLSDPVNVVELKHALIFLARLWLTRGQGRRGAANMRGYSQWASVMSGILREISVTGFMENANRASEEDIESAEWERFLTRWYEIHGNRELTTTELYSSMTVDAATWGDSVIVSHTGEPYKQHALSVQIGRHAGRFYGQYSVTRREAAARSKYYRVVQFGHETEDVPGRDVAELDTRPVWMKE